MVPSLRRRLLYILIPATVIIWVLATVASYYDTRRELDDLLDAHLAQTGRALLEMSRHELLEQKLLSDFSDTGEIIDANIWDHELSFSKTILLQVWVNNSFLALRTSNAPRTPLTKQTSGFSEIKLHDKQWRIYAIQSEENTIRVLVGEQTDFRHELVRKLIIQLLIPLFLSLPLLFLGVWISIGQSLAPLQRLAERLMRRKANELTPIDDDRVPREVRPLTQALNRLVKQMRDAFDSERRFTSDAAHELRTPLAALKTHAEIALQAHDTEEQQQAVRQVVRGVNRATRLVEQLLTLARLDPDSGLTNVRPLDLFISAEAVISDEAPLAMEKDIEISLSATRGKFINGNPDSINVLVRNLVDNAIRYTPEHGVVDIVIERDEQHNEIVLCVDDSGPGIPPEDREQVFKRFYRRLGTKPSGSGLGLSIVNRIADLHGARMSLQTAPLGGLRVEVRFPASDASPPPRKPH